ncbi:MAG: NAD(P)-binding domain-containing protein, partial [bacterium]
MDIGFIGLGNMGGAMARNLLGFCRARAHRLHVFDINPAPVETLRALGAHAARSATAVASRAEVLFTSLPGAEQITALAHGNSGNSGDDGDGI